MKRAFIAAWLLAVGSVAGASTEVPPFSSLTPSEKLPPALRFIALPKIKRNVASLVSDQGTTVLRVDSDNSAGSVGLPFRLNPHHAPILTWRWKVSRILVKADMEEKAGDDFAGRVYVFFDVPLESLSFVERSKIRVARLIAGSDVPTAALCYVWDNKHRVGHTAWSPYSDRVRKIVLQSGPEHVGQWMSESRDVAADFKEAFGMAAPAVTGVAVGNDTDNTGESVTTWYGDVEFKGR